MPDARMLYLHALSPVHCGTGQAVSVIDLPISREKATGYPQVPGSTLKGVYRDLFSGYGERWQQQAFGEQNGSGDYCFGDQRILLLAVRSFFGTFARVTCPLVLRRFVRDAEAIAGMAGLLPLPAAGPAGAEIRLGEAGTLNRGNTVYLEDLDLTQGAPETALADTLGALLFTSRGDRDDFRQRFALISDEMFSFLSETATEVAARVSLKKDTKTVEFGPWYEELVPAETVFAGPVLLDRSLAADPTAAAALDGTDGGVIQVGGEASVGRGVCRVVVGK